MCWILLVTEIRLPGYQAQAHGSTGPQKRNSSLLSPLAATPIPDDSLGAGFCFKSLFFRSAKHILPRPSICWDYKTKCVLQGILIRVSQAERVSTGSQSAKHCQQIKIKMANLQKFCYMFHIYISLLLFTGSYKCAVQMSYSYYI